jgi:hypothetical protein
MSQSRFDLGTSQIQAYLDTNLLGPMGKSEANVHFIVVQKVRYIFIKIS